MSGRSNVFVIKNEIFHSRPFKHSQQLLCKCAVKEMLECLCGKKEECETAVWDGMRRHKRECVFHQHCSPA